jgi:hypothetical protein
MNVYVMLLPVALAVVFWLFGGFGRPKIDGSWDQLAKAMLALALLVYLAGARL